MASPLIVLGMHRSGTSCLTGSLQECGLFLGEVNTRSKCNPKGLREHDSFRGVNEAVLAAHGLDWKAPWAPLSWPDEQKNERDVLLAEFADRTAWGFKDPRTVFTLEGWLEAAPEARLAGTFRNPMAVAESLKARNGFELEFGMEIWLRYNRRLLEIHDRYPFPLLNFDWPLEIYEPKVRAAARGLGLRPPAKLAFPEAGLKHQTGGATGLDDRYAAVLAELERRAAADTQPAMVGGARNASA